MNIVVMATYNGSQFLIKQLESIRLQSKPLDKVIIIDDCSSDNTPSLIQDYISQHSLSNWEFYQQNENQGHYKTFFSGLSKVGCFTKKDLIFLSDQDDIWDLNKVEEISQRFSLDDEITMVACRSRFIDQNDKLLYSEPNSGKNIELSYFDICKKWPSGYQMALRADILKIALDNKIYDFEGFYFHDVLLALFYGLYGKQILLDMTLDNHRLHTNNATKRISKPSIEPKEKVIKHLVNCQVRFNSMNLYAKKNKLLDRSFILEKMIYFFKNRESLIIRNSFWYVLRLLRMISFYERKKVFLRDIFYTYLIR